MQFFKSLAETVVDLGILTSILFIDDIKFYSEFLKLSTQVLIFVIGAIRLVMLLKTLYGKDEKDKSK